MLPNPRTRCTMLCMPRTSAGLRVVRSSSIEFASSESSGHVLQRGYTNKSLIRAGDGLNKANPPPPHLFVFVDEASRGLERDLRLGPLKGSECAAAAASDCDGAFAADSFPSDIARLQERGERERGRVYDGISLPHRPRAVVCP